jgi:hypothetical protein
VLGLHKASFVIWFGATAIHVLAHVLRVPRLVAADWRRSTRLPAARLRAGLLAAALVGGAVLAAATVSLANPWLDWAAR